MPKGLPAYTSACFVFLSSKPSVLISSIQMTYLIERSMQIAQSTVHVHPILSREEIHELTDLIQTECVWTFLGSRNQLLVLDNIPAHVW